MAIQVKIGAGETFPQHQQIKGRLEALGLKLNDDNTIDESSADAVQGGLEAIQALTTDGILDAEAITKLRRRSTIIGQTLGWDLPISEKKTQAWQALGLEIQGAANTMSSVAREMNAQGSVTSAQLDRVEARFASLNTALEKLGALEMAPESLAQVDPEALAAVATHSKALAVGASSLQSVLSTNRAALLSHAKDVINDRGKLVPNGDGSYSMERGAGWFKRNAAAGFANSVFLALEMLPTYAKLQDIFAREIGHPANIKPPLVQGAKEHGVTGSGAMVMERVLAELGPMPSLFPGSLNDSSPEDMGTPALSLLLKSLITATREDMKDTRTVSNAYGNSYTGSKNWSEEGVKSVPRDIFNKTLAKVADAFTAAMTELGPEAKASQVQQHVTNNIGPRYGHAASVMHTVANAQI